MPDNIIREDYPLCTLSTLGTGGRAEFFAQPESSSQLQEILSCAANIPVSVIGGGSNIIIPDGIIHGLTISTRKLSSIAWHGSLTAEISSGYSLPVLVKSLKARNMGGLEFCAGIPGTIGGAIMGNAGAGGQGVCEFVDSVNALDSQGRLITYRRGEFEYGYRHCSLKGVIVVSAVMTFREAMTGDDDMYSAFMAKRRTQPLTSRSAGCTFKNPEGRSAGKLLDECGCKGLTIGGAKVSDKHANFIINAGNASSSDVMELAGLCARIVHEHTGIILEPEIRTLSPCFCAL